ncbi:uncharacterized protein ANIA_11625 [Aspergillus nidulans FGSC A4]|uniref:Uncharacterized protein n=1 Tax=Emericella nidulans (strain FGSC A4 / ATCC 38163 / CBS 112.46 / NRRL 194 / M139) TaxID=227321 RepID=C8VAG2_EMENI|nr:hypothetical protein [Aspergillus nidulans FGSC A4]CBF78339.1 TPA: hypothetical protein ANIA_11625 [Aspergillus nidulans FGSC A4]
MVLSDQRPEARGMTQTASANLLNLRPLFRPKSDAIKGILKSTVRKPRMSSMAELRAAYAVFLEAWAYVSTSDDDGKTH